MDPRGSSAAANGGSFVVFCAYSGRSLLTTMNSSFSLLGAILLLVGIVLYVLDVGDKSSKAAKNDVRAEASPIVGRRTLSRISHPPKVR